MRNFIGICCSFLILTGCSKEPPVTVEEQVLTRSMAMLQSAKAFNEICNKIDPKNNYDFSKKENAMIIGNEQMLAARLGGVRMMHQRDANIEGSVEELVKDSKKWQDRAKKMLEKNGCTAEAGIKMGAAYKVYSTINMIMLMQMIDAQIIKEGGTVTPPDKFEELGPVPSKK